MNYNIDYDDYDDYYRNKLAYHPPAIFDLDVVLDIHTHWTTERSEDNRTIWGRKDKGDGISYYYSDRFYGWDYDKTVESYEKAALVAKPKTARYYQEFLKNFHGKEVHLKHIMAGCNRNNGYDYLVFGYTIKSA